MTNRLDLTFDERRALLMLHYGASGASNAVCADSVTVGAVANLLAALANCDAQAARGAIEALGLPGVHVDR